MFFANGCIEIYHIYVNRIFDNFRHSKNSVVKLYTMTDSGEQIEWRNPWQRIEVAHVN